MFPIPFTIDDIPEEPDDYDPNDFYWSELGHLQQKYMWNTWGDNCVICNAMRGKVYTLDFWINAGIWPGFHPGCDCTMKMVGADVPTSDPDFFGTNVPEYAKMWLPGPNLVWDPEFLIQPWQMSIVENIEQMHLAYGADMPFSEVLKKMRGQGIFSHRPSFYGDTAGWRVLATQRFFQDIDRSFSGSKYFTFRNVAHILEPFWVWFERRWKTNSVWDPNKKYSQMKRNDTPLFPKPATLRPWMPFQTYYTQEGIK